MRRDAQMSCAPLASARKAAPAPATAGRRAGRARRYAGAGAARGGAAGALGPGGAVRDGAAGALAPGGAVRDGAAETLGLGGAARGGAAEVSGRRGSVPGGARAPRGRGAAGVGRVLAAALLAACLLVPAGAWADPADGAAGADAAATAGDGAATGERGPLGVEPLAVVDGGVPLVLTGAAGEHSVLVRVAVEPAEGAQLEAVEFAFAPALEERAVAAEAVWGDGALTIVATAGDADLGADAAGRLELGTLKPVVTPAGAAAVVTVERVEAADARYVETAAAGAPVAGPVTLALTDGAGAGSNGGTGAGTGASGSGSTDAGAGAGASGTGAGAGATAGAADEAPYAPLLGTALAPTGDAAPMLAAAMVVVLLVALVVLIIAWRRRR